MFRPNLFRALTVLSVFTVACTGYAGKKHPGKHQIDWAVPGVHIPQSQYQAPILDYYVGQKPQIWDDQQPVEHFMGELAKRSWLRVDYLHWTLARPGSLPIGAPVLNPVDPFIVFDNNSSNTTGNAIRPDSGNMALDDTSGIRGTWGLDLANADLELEFFGTEQNSDQLLFQNLAAGRASGSEALGTPALPNVAVPLLTDGSAADASSANYLIFDNSFETTLASQIWGAEATLLSEPYIQGPGMTWQWLGGFRYVSYEEEFRSRGVRDGGGTAIPVTSSWNAQARNNMYGPTVGGRISAVHKWFTFSATPRIAFTLNDYSGTTRSLVPDAGFQVFSGNDIEFTPIVQVSFTGEIHCTPNFSIFGGYDFMWIYRMTRPFDNIVYDSTSLLTGGFTPNIRQEIDLESFYTRGLSFGCVFRY